MAIYLGLFFGVFLEGEIVYVTSIIAAHHEHLRITWIIVIGFLASVLADLFFYGLGKMLGENFFSKKKKFATRIEKATEMMKRKEKTVLLTYRFILGFRMVMPILLGIQNYSFARFVFFSITGSVLFVVVLTSLGLLFGNAITYFLSHIKQIEFYLMGALAVTGIGYKIYKVRMHYSIDTQAK